MPPVSMWLSHEHPSTLQYTYVLNLVLVEGGYLINDDPRQTPSKVECLVHDEAHYARCQHIVADIRVPRRPQPLEDVQRHVVFGDFVEFVPVGVVGVRQHGVCEGRVGRIVTEQRHFH